MRSCICRSGGASFVPLAHSALDFDGAAPCVYGTCELDQDSIACSLDDAAAMLGYLRFEKLAPVCVEALERALFVGTHEPTVASDIPCEDGSKPAFDPLLGHEIPPDTIDLGIDRLELQQKLVT